MVDPARDPRTPASQAINTTTGSTLSRPLFKGLAVAGMVGLLGIAAATASQSVVSASPDPLTDMALVAALEGKPSPAVRPASSAPATPTVATIATAPDATQAATGLGAFTEEAVMDFATDAGGAAADSAVVTRGITLGAQAALAAPPRPVPEADIAADAGAEATDGATAQPKDTAWFDVPARVESGDTLIGLLIEAGVDRIEAHRAIKALEEVYDPRGLRPGNVITVSFTADATEAAPRFNGFAFEPSVATAIAVRVDPNSETGYQAQETQEDLVREVVRYGGPITLSLYQAAVDAGVSEAALADMIRVLSYDIDFQRDIQKDDTFEIMYERFMTEDGEYVRNGDLLFTALTNGGRRIVAYAYETEDGVVDYFDEQGHGVRKPLMRTPIDGARISSPFGMRHHPILGYSKMHTGVDFAAPTGTPIYAAGDGVVKRAGWNGGYGNYVQIRHNGEFSTAYGHMSRILVQSGQRVHQGDVIGRVGTTGRSTGPHLHYEVIRNGDKVNPMDVRFQPATKLAGADLENFLEHRTEVDRLYASLRNATEVASTRPAPDEAPAED